MSTTTTTNGTDRAVERVKSLIQNGGDAEARYPKDTLFLAADHADFARILKRSLLEGSPVVVIYADGRERFVQPKDPSEVGSAPRLAELLYAVGKLGERVREAIARRLSRTSSTR